MSIKQTAHIVNAFTMNGSGGNPAGVVLDADILTPEVRQRIAKTVGFSETAFVSKSSQADYKLEYYTPTRKIPFCGHATVATFGLLKALGKISDGIVSMETDKTLLSICIERDHIFMEQQPPSFSRFAGDYNQLATSLGLNSGDFVEQLPPMVVSTGVPFLLIGVRNVNALKRICPDLRTIRGISKDLDLIGFYVFVRETEKSDIDAHARMFAPLFGIDEESATGMAAGSLAAYLRQVGGLKSDAMVIEQGHLMNPPSPSLLEVRISMSGKMLHGISVGGTSTVQNIVIVSL